MPTPTREQIEEMIAFDITHGYWYAHGTTGIGGTDFWRPEELSEDGASIIGETGNFHDTLLLTVTEYMSMRDRPVVKVGLWSFMSPGPDVADIRYAHQYPSGAGSALYRASEEQGELRAKLEDLQRRIAYLRDAVLDDSNHDDDTIEWALGMIDDALGKEAGTEPAAATERTTKQG